MRYIVLLLVLLLMACSGATTKYVLMSNDVNKVEKRYLAGLSKSDTAIVYVALCSGCYYGMPQTVYRLKKRRLSTRLSCTTNYYKTKSKDTTFCWECIIAAFQSAAKERYVRPKEQEFFGIISHGPFRRLTFHLGATVTTYEMGLGSHITPAQEALMDTLDSYFKPFRWKITKRKLSKKEPR